MRNRKRYGRDWRKRIVQERERVGSKCTNCGITHGAERFSPFLERDVKVWLQCHHPDKDPENPRARVIVVCPRCHWRIYHAPGQRPAWLIEAMKHRKLLAVAYVVGRA
jgi:hypothetical protein